MGKRNYIFLAATIIFFTGISYHLNNPAKITNNTRAIEIPGDKSAGQRMGKIFLTNVTCGGNLSN